METFETQCELFNELILKYNKTHNITGAKDKASVMENIRDSIFPLSFLDTTNIKTAIDVGSGAGFPGLMLALYMPHTQFILFEPIKKKSAFLHLAKSSLGLKNVEVCSKRVEEHEGFACDLICSRAVTNSDMLISLSKKFITPKSQLLFYKGENVIHETKHLQNYQIHKRGKRNYLLIKDIDVN